MILDSGICTVFGKQNVAGAGRLAVFEYVQKAKSWYGVRSFSTVPRLQDREEISVSYSIRILQNMCVNNHDVVILDDVDAVDDQHTMYEVIRAFHGVEDFTGTPITDIDLEVIRP